MPFSLTVTGHFDSAHSLPGYDGKCSRIHGHTWGVEVVLGPYDELDQSGISVDFTSAKKALNDVLDSLDHQYLNDILSPPSAEHLSKYIFERLLKQPLLVEVVRVAESPGAVAEYRVS